MDPYDFTELIPRLPDEIAFECLTRVDYLSHQHTSQVSKRWHQLLRSRDFYYHRKQTGRTHKLCCWIQVIPTNPLETKQLGTPSYGISVFDPFSGTLGRIDPVPKYPNGLPLFCQVASTEGKLFVIGGWNPSSWEVVKDVFMYDFTTQRWTQCADMPSTRSFFAVGAVEGRLFISGGHDEDKNALNSACAFNINSNEWAELPRMSEERDECQGIVVGSEFWVVSGYETQTQGGFKDSADVFNSVTGQWKRVEDVWRAAQCPRSCVGVGHNGKLLSWAECDPDVGVGVCGVDLGDRVVITGSCYRGVFVALKCNGGQIGYLTKVEVPDEFYGFVQSGCCVEI